MVGFSPSSFGRGRFSICGGLHVGGLAEHLHQFRHIDEPGKARVEPVARAVRRKFHRRHRLAKRRRPGIEMMQVVFLQFVVCRYRCMVNISAMLLAMGVPVANTTPPPPLSDWMWRTFRNISKARSQAVCGRPGNARHFGDVKQILEIVRLVHKQPVHAKFLKGQRVVLFLFGSQRLKFGFQPFFRLFEFFHQAPIGTVRVLSRLIISNSWSCSLKNRSWVSRKAGFFQNRNA